MRSEAIIDPGVHRVNGVPSFSSAIAVDDIIFLSGHSAGRGSDGTYRGQGDVAAQLTVIFDAMQRHLEEAGASMHDLVRVTIFATSPDQRAVYSSLKTRYFGSPPPASAFVVVAGLADPEALIEIDGIAVRGFARSQQRTPSAE